MIPVDRAHLYVAAFSHKGMREGKINEDRYAISSYQFSEDDPTPVLFAVVADGIGGHQAGEVAAEMVVNHVSQAVADSNGAAPMETIAIAVDAANEAIVALSEEDDNKQGMGATCVCIWVVDRRLYAGYVGDSRLYLMRGASIQQLSIDHTWIQEAMDKGIITPEQSRNHPNVHVIRRYIGSSPAPEVDFRLRTSPEQTADEMLDNQGMHLQGGDILLLCTDGLTDLVWNDEILEIIRSKKDLRTAAQSLIAVANERGGHDNTTVVLINVPHTPKKERALKKISTGWLVGGVVGLFALIAAGIGFLWYLLRPVSVPDPTPTTMVVGVGSGTETGRSRYQRKPIPAAISANRPTTPPTNQPVEIFLSARSFFGVCGTLIKTTVVLSCPPRSFATAISDCAAVRRSFFERMISKISSFQTRSVNPSVHSRRISPPCRCMP